jgi:alkylated DNA nucleotide flippase Atl1
MLRALPIGETISYGALAAKFGTRDAREVTKAIASCWCHAIASLRRTDRSRAIAGASSASASCWPASDRPNPFGLP